MNFLLELIEHLTGSRFLFPQKFPKFEKIQIPTNSCRASLIFQFIKTQTSLPPIHIHHLSQFLPPHESFVIFKNSIMGSIVTLFISFLIRTLNLKIKRIKIVFATCRLNWKLIKYLIIDSVFFNWFFEFVWKTWLEFEINWNIKWPILSRWWKFPGASRFPIWFFNINFNENLNRNILDISPIPQNSVQRSIVIMWHPNSKTDELFSLLNCHLTLKSTWKFQFWKLENL